MAEFSIRSDSVDVEEIMGEIRARIQDKRGVDYTEEQIREIAAVKLDKFLDGKSVRYDLMEHYRRQRVDTRQAPPPLFVFTDDELRASSRGVLRRLVALSRRVLNPVLKRFFAPKQRELDAYHAGRQDVETLHFELFNNLIVNITRMAMDVSSLKMQVEALSGRLDFDERRARALETVVQYRPDALTPDEDEATGRRSRQTRGRRSRPSSAAPESNGEDD